MKDLKQAIEWAIDEHAKGDDGKIVIAFHENSKRFNAFPLSDKHEYPDATLLHIISDDDDEMTAAFAAGRVLGRTLD